MIENMDRDAVSEYVEQSDAVLEASPQMGEATTKAAILQSQKGISFLELLNWDIPENTRLEYSVEAFGNTYKVDYALILDGTPVAFLEAKGADTSLTADHEEQLSSYMMNRNVTYGILTNGKQYRFFQRRVDASNVDVQKVDDMALEELPDNPSLLNAYTKDAIETGKSEDFFERINELREARQTLEDNKDSLAVKLSNLLTDEISDSISSLAETQSKELVDRLVEDIESEIDTDGAHSTTDIDGSLNQPDGNEIHSEIEGEYVIEIRDGDSTLVVVNDENQSEVMKEAVNYLITDQDLVSQIESFPYIPGKSRAILHESDEYDGKSMRQPKNMEEGYILETNLNAKQKQREVQRLADKCGVKILFENW
jgi:hypothetical protein